MSNCKAEKPHLRCKVCKRRIRGSNHENGSHHKAAVEKLRRATA